MDKKSLKKVLICGAGSIGVYLGTLLFLKGHDIKLFGKRKLKGVGKDVVIEGKKFKVPERFFKLPKNGKYDFVFITTKLYDFGHMIKILKKNKINSKIIVSIQNGLFDMSKYSSILRKKIIPIVVFSGFNLKNNKLTVNATSVGWKIEDSKTGKKISKFLWESGIPCKTAKNFDSLRAEKTIVNCCLNALSAIENKPFCELFREKKTRERIYNLFEECYKTLAKEYKLENPEKMKNKMIKTWSKLKHYSSTCQDIKSGRKNEVKYFNGYIVKLGRRYNLDNVNNREIVKEINKKGLW